jgi:hypothetical protein
MPFLAGCGEPLYMSRAIAARFIAPASAPFV